MFVTSFIARRFLSGRKKMFASFLSLVAVLGVALGTFALVVVMSVMTGFSQNLQQKLIGFNAHIVVDGGNGSLDVKNFESAVVIEGEGIIETGDGTSAQGVKIRGMDEADFGKLKGVQWYFPDDLRAHAPFDLAQGRLTHLDTAVLGVELAQNLGVNDGDRVSIIMPIGDIGPTGEFIPKKASFNVSGTFKSDYFEYDTKTVIISKDAAARLLDAKPSLYIWLKDFKESGSVADKIRKEFPGLKVQTWAEANRKLFAALKLERIAMTMLLVLIVMVASISIISVIFMYVSVRRLDIAVLMAMGFSKGAIRSVFLRIGGYIGAAGVALGMTCGLAVCWYLQHKKLSLPSSYYLEQLPVIISWPFLIAIALCGVLLSLVASFYPSNQASGIEPAGILRYE